MQAACIHVSTSRVSQIVCSKTGAAKTNRNISFKSQGPNLADLPASLLRMCEASLAQENGELQCFFMVKHATVWQPKHDRVTKRDTNIQSLRALFVQKNVVGCSKTCFKILVKKMFQTTCFFLCAQNVSPDE